MRNGRLPLWAAIAGTFILAMEGCGDSPPSVSGSTAKATVTGKVTANGSPVTSGEVIFNPANINRKDAPTAKATLGKDGSYSVETLVGENQVQVMSPSFTTRELQYNDQPYTVPSGGGTFDISLPKK
jgi:hypothetical protein